ncbi:hypothetical protein CDAR_369891 [Caerostris darwini]|uniref:Uncharacterized protein n=1 Tax=Caerostris darwini TaxID=1538125 RepID=A0AAV4PXX5_9ARAC|nr:hypothetical protein CDAR_369891 [Caerostris darwini]
MCRCEEMEHGDGSIASTTEQGKTTTDGLEEGGIGEKRSQRHPAWNFSAAPPPLPFLPLSHLQRRNGRWKEKKNSNLRKSTAEYDFIRYQRNEK